MFCKNCGHEMKNDEKFCSNCGNNNLSKKNKTTLFYCLLILLTISVIIVVSFVYGTNAYKYNKVLSDNRDFVGTKLIIECSNQCNIDGQVAIISNNLVKWGYEDAILYSLDKKRILVIIPKLINTDIIKNVVSYINKGSLEFKKFNNGKWINSDIDMKDIKKAFVATNAQNSEYVVSFEFNDAGSKKFAQLTQENIGKPLAIFINGELEFAPIIKEPILGGEVQISGDTVEFTQEEANIIQGIFACTKYQGKVVAKKTFF